MKCKNLAGRKYKKMFTTFQILCFLLVTAESELSYSPFCFVFFVFFFRDHYIRDIEPPHGTLLAYFSSYREKSRQRGNFTNFRQVSRLLYYPLVSGSTYYPLSFTKIVV